MNTLFDHMWFVSVYLEDSLILSHTPEEHADHVRQFLFILQDNNLHSKLRRNNFFPSSVQLLGRIIFAHRIRMSPEQVEIESNWSVPVDLRSLHSFLGLMKYYRRFIRALAKTAAPWIILPTKSVHSNWPRTFKNDFEHVRDTLTCDLLLKLLDLDYEARV